MVGANPVKSNIPSRILDSLSPSASRARSSLGLARIARSIGRGEYFAFSSASLPRHRRRQRFRAYWRMPCGMAARALYIPASARSRVLAEEAAYARERTTCRLVAFPLFHSI